MSTIAQRIASLGLYDPDVTAWVLAVRTAGASVSVARARQVSTLVNALKAANIWNSLDRLWLHAAENATQALIDLKARSTATAVNSPTFTTDRGYAGNGTTSYIDTNFNAFAGGVNFTQNDAGMGVWVETAGGGYTIGNNDSAYSGMADNVGGNTRQVNVNSQTNAGTFADTVHVGFLHAMRTASNAQAGYRDGVQKTTAGTTSSALINRTHRILVNVSGGGALNGFSTARVAASFAGASLAGKELAFHTPMRTYMTAVGVP